MGDLCENIDIGQFGGQRGVGTEHMIVSFVDRILKLLDRYSDKSAAIIAIALDWAQLLTVRTQQLQFKSSSNWECEPH